MTGPLEILLQDREVRILTGKTAEEVFSEVSNIQHTKYKLAFSIPLQLHLIFYNFLSASKSQNISKIVEESGQTKCDNEVKDKQSERYKGRQGVPGNQHMYMLLDP